MPNARWIAIRLLDGDAQVEDAPVDGPARQPRGRSAEDQRALQPENRAPGGPVSASSSATAVDAEARGCRCPGGRRCRRVSATRPCDPFTTKPTRVAQRAVHQPTERRFDLDQRIDRIVTSPVFGLPLMTLLLAIVFWLTIAGANVPSAMLAEFFFWIEDHAAAFFDRLGTPVVADGLHLARRLSRTGVGHQRHAAADGDLLPAVHDPGGSRLPAPSRVQPGLPVQARRCARQAGADHGDGIRLQRRGHHRDPRDRLAARAADRHPDQQLRAVQRAVPDADHARHDFRRRRISRRRSRRSPRPARSSAWC